MKNKLTPRELSVMEAVWTAHAALNRLLFRRDILRYGDNLKSNMLTGHLSSLVYKEFLRPEQLQGMSRGYLPLVSREEYAGAPKAYAIAGAVLFVLSIVLIVIGSVMG